MVNNIKGLSNKEKRAIAEFERLLLMKFLKNVDSLILFGSKARGDSNRNADLDLLVVLRAGSNKYIKQEIVSLTHEPIAHFGVELSPILAEEKELKGWSPFSARIKEEGIVLWKNAGNM